MTVYDLMDDLETEIRNITKDIVLKDVKGNLVKLNTFKQNLPERQQNIQAGNIMGDGDGEEDPYPYCVIRVDSGSLQSPLANHEVRVYLIFGIWDDDMAGQGYQAVLTMIQRIMERFINNPVLLGKYMMNVDAGMDWILDEENQYPYYFGSMAMTWDMAIVRRNDRYV